MGEMRNMYIILIGISELTGLFESSSAYSTVIVQIKLKLLNPTGHVMHQQFNIQQLYALPTLYLCVLYLSENKQRLVPLAALTDWFL